MSKIKEGVGDEYLKRKYPNYVDDHDEFERKYKAMQLNKDNIIASNASENWYLIKNPKSLKNFGEKVRGVITLNGDLYIESFSNVIHHDILKILFEKNIITGTFTKSWSRKKPDENMFITVQRFKNTNILGIGESNKLVYSVEDWDKYKNEFEIFLNRAKPKNPNIEFSAKLVGVKFNGLKSISATNRITENTDMRNLLK